MQNFSETQGREPFDWNDFLRRAQAGETDYYEQADAEERAGDWVTCACGNQCDALPRDPVHHFPLDEKLHKLGHLFNDNIEERDWKTAAHTLALIEKRSVELLAGLSNEQP